MSKFTPAAIILTGAGGASGAYYYAPKPSNKPTSSIIKVKFKDKYKAALLNAKENGDSQLWKKKWDLMQEKEPTHPKLKESLQKKDQNLHKEACQEIYSSSVMATPYFFDFKNYCSKNNQDGLGGSWIADGSESKPKPKNKWDDKLTKLKSAKKDDLSKALLSLHIKLNPQEEKGKSNPFTVKDENRKELKDWCDYFASEMFFGEGGIDVKSAKEYCIE
ncbi:hypothetical protein HF1_04270 [Mycoplasma haemofelis str. Langford 1]|uniref:Uncharacterized protein n=1 Tax=Mycoplasma haemofelis (strain Langford 1) TaxID=941640 RepID=E8ZH14_MYCHL|nr:hypothetical protein [Mycoplasma haemofelis]CBY92435.1 hypothetical protein HF1_04270 [Mycoplasma haemofelis str. Langford 1]